MKTKKQMGKQSKKTKKTEKIMQKYIEFDDKLDPEEQELMDSIERGEWKPAANQEEARAFAIEAAKNYFNTEVRLTLRISSFNLDDMKALELSNLETVRVIPRSGTVKNLLPEAALPLRPSVSQSSAFRLSAAGLFGAQKARNGVAAESSVFTPRWR